MTCLTPVEINHELRGKLKAILEDADITLADDGDSSAWLHALVRIKQLAEEGLNLQAQERQGG